MDAGKRTLLNVDEIDNDMDEIIDDSNVQGDKVEDSSFEKVANEIAEECYGAPLIGEESYTGNKGTENKVEASNDLSGIQNIINVKDPKNKRLSENGEFIEEVVENKEKPIKGILKSSTSKATATSKTKPNSYKKKTVVSNTKKSPGVIPKVHKRPYAPEPSDDPVDKMLKAADMALLGISSVQNKADVKRMTLDKLLKNAGNLRSSWRMQHRKLKLVTTTLKNSEDVRRHYSEKSVTGEVISGLNKLKLNPDFTSLST